MQTDTIEALLDVTTLKRLHRDILRIRLIEERIVALYPEQEMRCPVHLSIGQEAVPVGVCAHLGVDDYVMSNHRSHAHYLAKGGSLKAMLAEFYGRATGCTSGRGGSMHLLDLHVGFLGAVPIVGATIPMAVGAAWASRMKNEPRVVVTFFGEGATEEGVFHEAINFAALKQLPVVFVCENNLYSVYSPLSVRQPATREVYELARGHGVPGAKANGNDPLAVYEAAGEAIARARNGGGPSFLEFETYRWREHCGPSYDNAIGYRTEAEFELWRERCPLQTFTRRLQDSAVLTDVELERATAAITNEIDEAVRFAKSSPFPDPAEMTDFTYAK